MRSRIIRWLFLTHRYLGIAVGLPMVMWCLSGIVMMYVHYPELPEARRLISLSPIIWQGCCVTGDTVPGDAPVTKLQVEMLAGHPAMRITQAGGPTRLIDLTSGRPLARIDPGQAQSVTLGYGAEPGPPVQLDHDQWTVSGEFRRDQPLYRFDFDDAARTQLYVSGASGKAVQITTKSQRFWNWLGAIPHWLYFTRLRAHVALWSQVVIWTSLLGCFLTGTGLYLGVRQILRAPRGCWSPYRGFLLWHHVPGLVFGIFALTWVLSGLISMNPWGFLDSEAGGTESERLAGKLPTHADIASALIALAQAAPADTVSISLAPFDGAMAFVAKHGDGTEVRIDGSGRRMAQPDMAHASEILGGAPAVLLTAGDSYYFNSPSETVRLPVYRVIAGDVRYYLDPVSGEIVKAVDANGRWYRWLHEGLHRLDFTPALRGDGFRDAVMLPLLIGAVGLCGTGLWLAFRRLTGANRL